MYSQETVVAVKPFVRQFDGTEVIIGIIETGVFLAVPAEAVELLDDLAAGKSIGETSDLYQQKHGETPDMNDFLELLEAKGFLQSHEENTAAAVATKTSPPQTRYHFSNFPQPLAQRLFSYPTYTLCLALIAAAVYAAYLYPSLIAAPADLYFPDHRALCVTLWVTAGYFTIFLHEMAHLVGARAAGVSSRMGISHRLWYLVAETDLTGLWALPKQKRYMPMLAGILLDAASAALLVLVLLANQSGWLRLPVLAVRVLRALEFTYVMRILWEFFFYVRTDLYYVIATLCNCRNLLGDTRALLRNQVARVIPWMQPIDQSGVPERELRFVRWYALLWLGGRIWAVFTLFWITVPVAVSYLRVVADAFSSGYAANPGNFVDAIVMATYFLVPTIAGLVLWLGATLRQERI